MRHHAPPTADNALLVYLAGTLSFIGVFVLVMSWLVQPKVLPNAGLAGFEKERRATVGLARLAPEVDIEAAAMTFARQENEKQGLRSVVTTQRASQPSPPPSKVGDATP